MGSRELPLTVTHWGAYRIDPSDGAVRVEPFELDADPSSIGQSLEADDRARVARPAIRRGWLDGDRRRDGSDEFIEVEWDYALDRVAAEIDRVRSEFGNETIYGGSYGWSSASRVHHAQTLLRRFLTLVGGYVDKVNTYSHAAGEVLLPHVVGMSYPELQNASTPLQRIADHCELLIAFGGIPLRTAQIQSGGVGSHLIRGLLDDAATSGTRFVNVSPVRTDLHVESEWVPCRPGSDVAIILGMLHTLIDEGLADEEFLSTHTVGWERLRDYVLGPIPKTPEWAAGISWVPAAKIRDLAREATRSRTMVSATPSLQRAEFGEQPWWAVIALASALGQIGLRGGGFGFSYGAFGSVGNGLPRVETALMPPVGPNPVDIRVPVARISDMLLDPGGRYEYDGATHSYPDVKLVYWAGGNPYHHHQDLNQLERAWQHPDTIVVNETFWTATARRADIVLPATTAMERTDLAGSPSGDFLFLSEAIRPPYAEARDDFEIFADLAARFDVRDRFTEGRTTSEWVEHLYGQYRSVRPDAPGFDEFRKRGYVRHSDTAPTVPGGDLLAAFREDPESNALGTPSGRIELYSSTIAGFGCSDCPGHPTWLAPTEWETQERYPIHIISNQPATRLHSQYDHGLTSESAKIEGREVVLLNPANAADRGVTEGDTVRVYNERGACLVGVHITEDVAPGVAVIPTGSWFDPDDEDPTLCRRGNVNAITQDRGTSALAQGSSAQTCLAEIELVANPPAPGSRLPGFVGPDDQPHRND